MEDLKTDERKKGDPLYLLKIVACAGLAGFGFSAGVDTYLSFRVLLKVAMKLVMEGALR